MDTPLTMSQCINVNAWSFMRSELIITMFPAHKWLQNSPFWVDGPFKDVRAAPPAGPLLMSLRPGAGALDTSPAEAETPANQDTEYPPDIIADLQDWTEDDTQSHDWISSRTCCDLNRTGPSEVRRKQRSCHEVFSKVRGRNALCLTLTGVASPRSAGATQAER